jgi:hypothetical protein
MEGRVVTTGLWTQRERMREREREIENERERERKREREREREDNLELFSHYIFFITYEWTQ